VGSRDTYVLTASALAPEVRVALDGALRQEPFYLGAFEVDGGNPVQRYGCLDTLIHYSDYRYGWLLFDPWQSEEPLDPPPLDRHDDEWYLGLGFDGVRYLTETEQTDHDLVPRWPDPGESPRGARSAAILAARRGQGHLDRLAEEASRLPIDDDTLPFVIELDAMPRAADAIVEEDKLGGYLLNPDHRDGGPKARWFKAVLAIEAPDAKHLSAQLRQGLLEAGRVERVRSTAYGVHYNVVTPVRGLNGVTALVRSGWELAPGKPPRLLTAVPGTGHERGLEAPATLTLPSSLTGAERWPALWQLADDNATVAAAAVVPTPMNFGGEWLVDGPFGFAQVSVRDARHGFARWLVQSGHADTVRGRGAVMIAPPGAHERARAYAAAFVEVLGFNGVEASYASQLN
jgi:hypothetical protein